MLVRETMKRLHVRRLLSLMASSIFFLTSIFSFLTKKSEML